MEPRMIWGKLDEFVARSRRCLHASEIGTVESTPRGGHRVRFAYVLICRAAPAVFSLGLLVPSYAAAAENEEIAVLRRMLGELRAENRKLSQRLSALEGASAAQHTRAAAAARARRPPAVMAAKPAPAVESPPVDLPAPDLSETATKRPLGQRVKEL